MIFNDSDDDGLDLNDEVVKAWQVLALNSFTQDGT